MKSKSEVRPPIISFHKMILIQFSVSFKALRFDDAFDFCIVDFFSANGIIHQKNCAYTPQQNFVVERKALTYLSYGQSSTDLIPHSYCLLG